MAKQKPATPKKGEGIKKQDLQKFEKTLDKVFKPVQPKAPKKG